MSALLFSLVANEFYYPLIFMEAMRASFVIAAPRFVALLPRHSTLGIRPSSRFGRECRNVLARDAIGTHRAGSSRIRPL